uniref:Uncharacterized protein n=1 Tax=Oryza sativa subsp. japonica TaxID=39947 RepID=Q2QTY8_ORYSJ|nr:hypothetical protein LOC_Os12g18090 [Oryza sativa Japonica Group]
MAAVGTGGDENGVPTTPDHGGAAAEGRWDAANAVEAVAWREVDGDGGKRRPVGGRKGENGAVAELARVAEKLAMLAARSGDGYGGGGARLELAMVEERDGARGGGASEAGRGNGADARMKFNLDLSEPHVKGCLELLFSSSYKTFHHRCYTHYLKSGGGDSTRNSPYEPLRDRPGDWTWLCDHFETEEFHKKSVIGKANRMKLSYVHKKGTKPFVALQHELSCDQISLYKECYCSDKGWASRDARQNYETMLQMQHENEQEGAIQLTEQQICEKVLGKAYGYIRGRGHGPKPNRRASSTSANTYQQMEEELASTKQTAAVQQNQLAVQQNQLESQQKQLDWLRSVVSKLAGIPPPAMDDNDASGPSHTTTTSIDGSAMQHFFLLKEKQNIVL